MGSGFILWFHFLCDLKTTLLQRGKRVVLYRAASVLLLDDRRDVIPDHLSRLIGEFEKF